MTDNPTAASLKMVLKSSSDLLTACSIAFRASYIDMGTKKPYGLPLRAPVNVGLGINPALFPVDGPYDAVLRFIQMSFTLQCFLQDSIGPAMVRKVQPLQPLLMRLIGHRISQFVQFAVFGGANTGHVLHYIDINSCHPSRL